MKSKILKQLLSETGAQVRSLLREQEDDDLGLVTEPDAPVYDSDSLDQLPDSPPEDETVSPISEEVSSQIDYLIYDLKAGNLFCLALESKDEEHWSVTKWVNLFGLEADEMKDMVDTGIQSMIEASMGVPNYVYNIGKHEFKANDIKNEYFTNLISDDKFETKASVDAVVDLDELMSELDKLDMNVAVSNEDRSAAK